MRSNDAGPNSHSHWLVWLPLATLLSIGCGCRSEPKRPGIEGYNQLIRNQQQALAIEQSKAPAVYVRGRVQNPVVPWREGFTLADALLEAGYSNSLGPTAIRVHRGGRAYNIDVRRLLRGTENPLLEPGDTVEVIR